MKPCHTDFDLARDSRAYESLRVTTEFFARQSALIATMLRYSRALSLWELVMVREAQPHKWCKYGEHFAPTSLFYPNGNHFSPSCKKCTCKQHKETYTYKRKPKRDGLKFCRYGDHYVPYSGFSKSKSAKQKDGLESRCRECRHKAHREKNPPAPHRMHM